MSELVVHLMREEDIDGAIDTIQQAFADDPYNNWIYPSREEFSPTRNRVSLTLRCHWGIKHGLFYVCRTPTEPTKVLGTAMWLPPRAAHSPHTWSLWASGWLLWFNQVRMNLWYGRGGLNVKRYYQWKAAQAKAQAATWEDARGYYFCNIVTVLPEAQGKGVGRKLMEVVLEKADSEGMPCYLESSRRDPNVAIYERFGFRLVREIQLDDDGSAIPLFGMIRDPVVKDGVTRADAAQDGTSN